LSKDHRAAEGADRQEPGEEQIRRLAYRLYRELEREFGGPIDDWLEAELLFERSDR